MSAERFDCLMTKLSQYKPKKIITSISAKINVFSEDTMNLQLSFDRHYLYFIGSQQKANMTNVTFTVNKNKNS